MTIKTLVTVAALALVAVSLSSPALAGNAAVITTVKRTMVTADSTYGGCMALLGTDPASLLPACGANWITFSCSGDFADPVRAYRMLDQAQLALATGKRVRVVITDTSQHNGYCFTTRIEVIQ